jgi:exopolysaccharide biosynthesis polyprenyl glycosylphosphotransferase
MAAPDFITSNLYVETIAPLPTARNAASREFVATAFSFVEMAAEFAACIAGVIAACILTAPAAASSSLFDALRSALPLGAALGFTVIFLSWREGAYRSSYGLLRIRETGRAMRVSAQALFLVIAFRLLLGAGVSWLQSLVALFAIPSLMILENHFLSLVVVGLPRSLKGSDRAVIYGAGEAGRMTLSALLQSPRLGLDPVAVIDKSSARGGRSLLEMGYRGRRSIPVENRPLSISLLKAYRCDLLLLAESDVSADEVVAATHIAHQAGAHIAHLRHAGAPNHPSTETIDVDGIVFATSRERSSRWLYTFVKRLADIVISSVLIVLLAPLLALIATLVRLDSRGPAIFVQKRVGLNGEFFDMLKFRSMFIGAARYAKSPTASSDPRITRSGRVLRRLSLDELPQLFNVLLGSMSLVGPRPEMPFIVERYDARQRARLAVKPGITGLWQLSADRAFPIHQNIEYDLHYIRNRTFSMDAAILIHTLVFALCGGV